MLEVHQITLTEYADIKTEIRNDLQEIVTSFVKIGYYLKQVRDNRMYLEDGYKDIWDFAAGEYKLDRTAASRFMSINDRYAVDGNSIHLQEQYKGFSKSTLTEMLTLPVEDHELITPDTRIEDIRELKRAEKEQEDDQLPGQESVFSLMPEAVPATEKFQPVEATLQEAIRKIFRPVEMKSLLDRVCFLDPATKDLEYWVEDMNPSGNRMDKVMPFFIFFYNFQDGVKTKNIVTQKQESYTYEQFYYLIRSAFGTEVVRTRKVWDEAFGEEYRIEQEAKKQAEQAAEKAREEARATKKDEKPSQEETAPESESDNNENAGALMKNAASGDLECSKSEEKEVQQVEESVAVSETVQNDTTETPKNVDFIQGEATLEESETEETEVVAGEVEEEEKTVCDIAQDTDPETGDLIGYTITLPVVPGESIYEIVPYSEDGDGNITYTVIPRTVYMYEIKNGNVVMRYHTDYASGEVTFKPDKTDAWSKLEENKMFVTEEQARQRMEQLNGKE